MPGGYVPVVHVWYGASVGIKKQGQQITAVPVQTVDKAPSCEGAFLVS